MATSREMLNKKGQIHDFWDFIDWAENWGKIETGFNGELIANLFNKLNTKWNKLVICFMSLKKLGKLPN